MKINKTLRLLAAVTKHYSSASGDVVSFMGDGTPLKGLVVNIRPLQAGIGDPSPENVRPISGWNVLNLWDCGKNLFDANTANWQNGRRLDDAGASVSASTYRHTITYIPIAPYTQYTISYYKTTGISAACTICGYDANQNFIKRITAIESTVATGTMSGTFTTGAWHYIRMSIPYSVSAEGQGEKDIQIEFGPAATTYETFIGQTIPITSPSPPGAVYGGTLDVTNGVLTVDREMLTLDGVDEAWEAVGLSNTKYFRLPIGKFGYAVDDDIISDRYKQAIIALSTTTAGINAINSGTYDTSQISIRPVGVVGVTVDDFKAQLMANPVQAVIRLAAPIEYTLTPQQIHTVVGANNVWADTGPVSVEYGDPQPGKLAVLLQDRREAEVIALTRKRG